MHHARKVVLVLSVAAFGLAQTGLSYAQTPVVAGGTDSGMQTVPQGGSATAGEFAPVLDSEKRPITAGGFVKTGPVVFQDISEKAGVTTWHHSMGTLEK